MPISPIIYDTGFIQITYYSLVYFIGFITVFLTLFLAHKDKKIPLKEEQVYDLTTIIIISVIIFARLFDVIFWDITYFKSNPMEILRIWKGGMSFHGGLFGAFLAIFFYAKKQKIPFMKTADLLIIPLTAVLALGRIANYINQEIPGTLTDSRWCITFETISGCRHPVQLYAAAGFLALFAILIFLKQKKLKEGTLLVAFLISVSIGRFFLDFIREDIAHAGLKTGQWFSLLTLTLLFLFLTLNFFRQRPSNLNKQSGQTGSNRNRLIQ